jgi:RND superfamily putative drug exporter
VPVKAAAMNLLSIAAAYGVLTFVVQEGHGAKLIGLDGPTPIPSFVPVFMFAILFGLSMDYEVFLLSRMREAYLDCGDNRQGVAQGLAATARVITSAALIMIAAFGAFILGGDPIVKTLGLGLAVAVFLDATLIRMLLVPASMTLMGRANWWLPRHLDRWLPRLHDSVERIGDKLPLQRPQGRARGSRVPALGGGRGPEVSPPKH